MASFFDLEKQHSGGSQVSNTGSTGKKKKSFFDLENEYSSDIQKLGQFHESVMQDQIKQQQNTETAQLKPLDQVQHEKSWEEKSLLEKAKDTLFQMPTTIKKHLQDTGTALDTGAGFEPQKPWEQMSSMEKAKASALEAPATITRNVLSSGIKGGSSMAGIAGFVGLDIGKDASKSIEGYQTAHQKGLAPVSYNENDNAFDNPSLLVNPEYILRNVVEQIPNLAVMTKTAGYGEGLLELGGAFDSRMQSARQRGEDTSTMDKVYAGSIGIVNGYLGKLGFDQVFKKNPALKSFVEQKVNGTIRKVAGSIGATGAEMGTEYLQEVIPQIATKVIFDEGGTWQEVLAQAHSQGKSAASSAGVISAPTSAINMFTADAPQGAVPAVQVPNKQQQEAPQEPQSDHVTRLSDAIESGNDEDIQAISSEMSRGELQDAKNVFENIRDNAETHGLDESQIAQVESHLETIDTLLTERGANIEKEATRIVDENPVDETAPVINEKDKKHVNEIVAKVATENLDNMTPKAREDAVKSLETVVKEQQTSSHEQAVLDKVQENNKKIDEVSKELKTAKEELLAKKARVKEDVSQKKEIQKQIDYFDEKKRFTESEKNKVQTPVAKSIDTEEDAAKDFLRAYVHRGDTIEDLQSGQMGVAGGKYNASIEKNGKIHITKLNGKELKTPKVFSLKKIYSDLRSEVKGAEELTKKEKNATVKPDKKQSYAKPSNNNNDTGSKSGQAKLSGDVSVGKGEQEGSGKSDTVNDEKGQLDSRKQSRNTGERNADGRKLSKKEIEDLVNRKDSFTDAEKEILKQYEGSGGQKDGSGRGVLDEYYTPQAIVDKMWELTSSAINIPVNNVLEPSAGVGRFFEGATGARIDAFEINPVSAKIAQTLYPQANVVNGSFESLFVDEKGKKKDYVQKYEVVIGNPPYGAHRGKYKGLGEETKISRYEEYFIKRSLDLTKEGGVVAMIIPSGFLRSGMGYAKSQIAIRGDIVTAYRMPNGSFGTTDVGTDILIIKKHDYSFGTETVDESIWQGDNYFKQNPNHILGTEGEKKGRFGMEKAVKGSLDEAIKKIETQGVADVTSEVLENTASIEVEQPMKDEVVKKAVKKSTEARVRKTKAQKTGKDTGISGLFKRSSETPQIVESVKKGKKKSFMQGDISPLDEKYLKNTEEDGSISGDISDSDKKRLNFYGKHYFSDFNYYQGDIRAKLEQLEKDKGSIEKSQYERQKKGLEAILPQRVSINRITILPISTVAKDIKLSDGVSLIDGFINYIQDLPYNAFEGSNQWEIRNYLSNTPVSGGDKVSNAKTRVRRRKVGNKLFKKYYKEELEDADKKIIEDTYNETFNSYYKPDYTKFPLQVEMFDKFYGKDFNLKEIQLEGAAFLLNKGVGILAYEVGVGKTLSGIAAITGVMQKGWAKRPLIVVPKNLKTKWIKDMVESMPNIKINDLDNLGGGLKYKGDKSKLSIEEGTLSIITEEGFKRIGFTDATYSRLTNNLEDVMYEKGVNKNKRSQEIEKANTEATIGKAMKNTDFPVTFEDFGFDHITIDEAHRAKNVFSKAKSKGSEKKSSNEYGAVHGSVSERGLKTYLATQYILEQNKGRNVFLLTATPFNNSPIEIYSMLSLVAKARLEQLGIKNINDFISMFVELESKYAIKANGTVELSDQVRNFDNLQQLQMLVREYIDFRTGEEAGIQRPEKEKLTPMIMMTEKQAGLVLKAQELFSPALKKEGGTLQAITELQKITFSPYLSRYSDKSISQVSPKEIVESSPKIKYAVEAIKKVHAVNPHVGQIIYSEKGIELFEPIRQHFIKDLGYKPTEVAIIDSSLSGDAKDLVQQRFQNGEVRVLLASGTVKEGVDLQRNSTDLYNLYLQWNPTDMIQTEGRTWRQGSMYDNVRIHYPLIQNSIDPFIFQKLDEKASRIASVFSYKGDSLDVSDIDFEGMKFDLITDPVLKVQAEFDFKNSQLKDAITVADAELAFIERRTQSMSEQQNNIDYYTKALEGLDPINDERLFKYYTDKVASNTKALSEEREKLKKKGISVADIEKKSKEKRDEIDAIKEKIDALNEKLSVDLEVAKEAKFGNINGVNNFDTILKNMSDKEFFSSKGKAYVGKFDEKMLSIKNDTIATFLDESIVRKEIERVLKSLSPDLRKKAVIQMVPRIVSYSKDGSIQYAAGDYDKQTSIIRISQSQPYESMQESVAHEIAHFAWMNLQGVERASIIDEVKKLTPEQLEEIYGKTASGNSKYKVYLRQYNGNEIAMIEETAVTWVAKEALDNFRKTGAFYVKNARLTPIQKIVRAFAELFNKIAKMIKLKYNIEIPPLSGMDIMREIYNSETPIFKGKKTIKTNEAGKEMYYNPYVSLESALNEVKDEPVDTKYVGLDEYLKKDKPKQSKMNVKSVSIDDIHMDPEVFDAIRDVENGQTSPSKLPILLKPVEDGKYEILDGRHRIAQGMNEGKRNFLATFDEKVYREYAQREEEGAVSKTVQVREHTRNGSKVSEHTRVVMNSVIDEKPLVKNGKISIAALYRKVYSELYEGKPDPMNSLAEEKIIRGMTKRSFTLGKRYATKVTKDNYKKVSNEIRDYVMKNVPLKERGALIRSVVSAKNAQDVKIIIDRVDKLVASIKLHNDLHEAVVRLIADKNLQKDRNMRLALKLPPIDKMNNEQLKLYYDTLNQFQQDDEFLSKRTLETIDNTELKGIRTYREAKERLADRMGVDTEQLTNVTSHQFDQFRFDASLAERNPFYEVMVDDTSREMLTREAEYLKIEKTTNDMIKKARESRKRTIADRLVPMDTMLHDYLSAKDKTAIAQEMTQEELEAGIYIEAQYRRMYDYLVEHQMLKGSRFVDNYVTNLYRGFFEAFRTDGFAQAMREVFVSQKKQEAMFKIVSGSDTQEILPYEKFFQFALFRSGTVKPTQNVAHAFLTYTRVFQKKHALDALIPKLMVYVKAIQPQAKTEKGLLKDSGLEKFVKEWVNNKKGRKSDIGGLIPQGGKIDTGIRILNSLVTILDIGLSIPSGIASIGGEQATNYTMLGAKQFAKGTSRMFTAKGKQILADNVAFTGRSAWETLSDQADNIGDKTLKSMFVLFHAAQVRANKQFLLGSISDKEFETGVIIPQRLAELKREMGRWRVVDESKSIVGNTSIGTAATKYKTWAIPILRTTIANTDTIVKRLKAGETVRGSRELNELVRSTVIMSLVGVALMSMLGGDDKDKKVSEMTFFENLQYKLTRDLLSTVGALDITTFVQTPRILQFMQDFGSATKQLVTLEEYKRNGDNYEEGDLKAPNAFKRLLEPRAIKQFE